MGGPAQAYRGLRKSHSLRRWRTCVIPSSGEPGYTPLRYTPCIIHASTMQIQEMVLIVFDLYHSKSAVDSA